MIISADSKVIYFVVGNDGIIHSQKAGDTIDKNIRVLERARAHARTDTHKGINMNAYFKKNLFTCPPE
jgi:hypothetical protein